MRGEAARMGTGHLCLGNVFWEPEEGRADEDQENIEAHKKGSPRWP